MPHVEKQSRGTLCDQQLKFRPHVDIYSIPMQEYSSAIS
jgi:hypothetical protein